MHVSIDVLVICSRLFYYELTISRPMKTRNHDIRSAAVLVSVSQVSIIAYWLLYTVSRIPVSLY